ncbi:MAG: 4Fe-4S dicluster domain-containing protein [Armatimonadota bacterium]|nr:4Fe-4S dicluster domain-containing protein [Armatimonadota bacterium]
MTSKALRADALGDWLSAILGSGVQLVAPVEEEGLRLFRPVERVEEICLAEGNTRWSFKEVLFPRSEPLLFYRFEGKRVELAEPELPQGETVVFGARPCDAAGLAVLDAVYSWDYDNPFYRSRRERTTIVGVSCAEPAPACFCTAAGLSPTGTRGSDLLLTRVGEVYLAEGVTEKGERLMAAHESFFTDAAPDKAAATAAAEEKISRKASIVPKDPPPLQALFDDPRWKAFGLRCHGCGTCAFICPTCHCFDIVDEGNARGGSRCKNWDSCGHCHFTLHTSGHNPRPNQPARVRQRVLHKLRYIPERFGIVACVGCGRCVTTCPVNVDIYEIAQTLGVTGR